MLNLLRNYNIYSRSLELGTLIESEINLRNNYKKLLSEHSCITNLTTNNINKLTNYNS